MVPSVYGWIAPLPMLIICRDGQYPHTPVVDDKYHDLEIKGVKFRFATLQEGIILIPNEDHDIDFNIMITYGLSVIFQLDVLGILFKNFITGEERVYFDGVKLI